MALNGAQNTTPIDLTTPAKCDDCPRGTYNGAPGKEECEKCPEGRYNNKEGSSSFSECVLCPAGTHGNKAGQTIDTCTGLCPPGKYSKEGMRQCLFCGKGQFQSKSKGASCTDCVPKETTLNVGGTTCVCAKTYYRDKSGNCTVCNPEDMDCEKEGITIETMDIVVGAWRANNGSENIYECPVKEACEGTATIVGFLVFPTIATPDEFTLAMKAGLKATHAAKCGVTADKITLIITAARRRRQRQRHQRRRLSSDGGGVNVTYVVQVDSKAAAKQGESALADIAAGGDTAMLSFIAELKENTPGGGFATVNNVIIAKPVVERGSSLCARGQTGVLCASCEKGWRRSGSLNMCEACQTDTKQAMMRTVGLSILALVVLVIVIRLDLHFGWTRQRGGGRLKPVINAVQQMTVMMLFPVKWPPMMMKLSSVFEGFSLDVSLVSPTCLGIPFDFYDRFMWSSITSFGFALAPFVGGVSLALMRALFPRWCVSRSKDDAVGDAGQSDETEQREEKLTAKLTVFYKQHITLDADRQEQLDKIPSLVAKYEGDYPKMWRALMKTYIDDKSTFVSRFSATWHEALPVMIIYSMTVILFVHPGLSGQAFFFFRCHEIKDMMPDPPLLGVEASDGVGNAAAASSFYLVADYSLECYDDVWYAMRPYTLFVVIVFSFGLPFVFLILLLRYRKDIRMIAQLDMIENSLKKMASFKASFDTYDVDGDGAISPPELRKAMADHGVKLSETEIAVIFNRIDVDGDGSISKVTSIRGLNFCVNCQ